MNYKDQIWLGLLVRREKKSTQLVIYPLDHPKLFYIGANWGRDVQL